MDGMWSAAAAGHIEPGESPTAAVIREAREELGLCLEEADLHPLAVVQRRDDRTDSAKFVEDHFFFTRKWSGNPAIAEPDRAADLRWFSLKDLPPNVVLHELSALHRLAQKQ